MPVSVLNSALFARTAFAQGWFDDRKLICLALELLNSVPARLRGRMAST